MKRIFVCLILAVVAVVGKAQEQKKDSVCSRRECKVCAWYRNHGSFWENGFEYQSYYYDTLAVSIKDYKCPRGEKSDSVFNIPASVIHGGTTYHVESISTRAFYGLSFVRSVVIGDGIEIIGEEAFKFCTNLESVYIPASVDWVRGGVFGSCPNLRKIVVSEQNKTLDSREGCNAVIGTEDNILLATCPGTKIPSSVKAIGEKAFYRQGTFEDIIIPDGVESIGSDAFSHCSNLRYISLPQSLRRIGHSAFEYCCSLRSLRIPKNVEYIGGNNFAFCDNLTSVVVDPGNPVYDSRENCNAIIRTADSTLIGGCRSSIIVDGVRRIDDSFCGVPLRSVHIPKSMTDIHGTEFYGCEIDSITVDEENNVYNSPKGSNAILTKDGKTLVMGCRNTEIPEGVEIIGPDAFNGSVGRPILLIPEGIKEIWPYAFCNNDLLEEVIIPRSVDSIGYYVFNYCNRLLYVKSLAPLEKIMCSTFSNCPQLHSVDIAEGTKKICKGAFFNCPKLKYVSIPLSTEVEEGAFKYCPMVEIKRK
jgi:hypothetical protein